MRRRKNSQQPNLKSVRVMVMGQDGVGKTGKESVQQFHVTSSPLYNLTNDAFVQA